MNIRVVIAGAGYLAAGWLAAVPATAQAQIDYEAIVRIMRECAKIEDVGARVACYDNTVSAERLIARAEPKRDGAPVPASAPPPPSAQATAPASAAAAPATPADASDFGAGSLPEPELQRESRPDEVTLAVSQAERVEPGIYQLTLSDGSQWRFVDAVPMSYDTPRSGATIELARAALGSSQMRYADQRPVRIRRIR